MGVTLKNLSSKDIVTILASFGFVVQNQKGRHIKLRRNSGVGKETLVVAERKQIPKGTLRAIFRQAARYISEAELRPHFYTKN